MSINKKQMSEFIQSLFPIENEGFKNVSKLRTFFSSKGYGTLLLEDDEARNYGKVIHAIIDELNIDYISPKAIEKLFQLAILKSIDLENKQGNIVLKTRIKNAIDEFVIKIKSKPKKNFFYYPIAGIGKVGLPFKFGKVEFRIFNEDDFLLFKKPILDYKGDSKEKEVRLSFLKDIKEGDLFDKTVAKIEVNVFDFEAGKTLSKKELSFTVDILNFYSDLIPYQRGYIYLPGQAQRQVINIAMIEDNDKPHFHYGWQTEGPLMPIQINKLIEIDKKNNLGLSRVSSLLALKGNDFEERLIFALRWAGSATSENDNEKSFLRYVIALEALILLENNTENIAYKLRTRVAQLLSEDFTTCTKIAKQMNNLYKIRSKIVHNGEFQVTDPDLSMIRFYAKNCIIRLLSDNEFNNMNTNDFLEWFMKRTYR